VYLGYFDPAPKVAARIKLDDAVARYRAKFDRDPEACLTSLEDAAELAADPLAPDLPVSGRHYIPRHTFYVGKEEPPDER
jgi:hypothetical protein